MNSPTAKLSPGDALAFLRRKLQFTANVELTEKRSFYDVNPLLPNHSPASAFPWGGLEWRATNGTELGGALSVQCGPWFVDDKAYCFAPGTHAMIVDAHCDDSMAFLTYESGESVDAARVVGARGGEENEGRFIASSMSGYLSQAVEACFAYHWVVSPERGKATRAWLDAQPLTTQPMFDVVVEDVFEASDALALRALALEYMDPAKRKQLGTATGYREGDMRALATALEETLRDGKPKAKDKVVTLLGNASSRERWERDLFFTAIAPGMTAVRLKTTRLESPCITTWGRYSSAQESLQLLLDAPGAETLSAAVDAESMRFGTDVRAADELAVAFPRQPEKALPSNTVKGVVDLVVILPTELVPRGCIKRAQFNSIAPARDGTNDGKRQRSV